MITNTLSADGSTPSYPWVGGLGTFAVAGTFGSGTVKLQASLDNGTTWIDVGTDVTFTATGMANFHLPVCHVRVNLSGATSPNISTWLTDTLNRVEDND